MTNSLKCASNKEEVIKKCANLFTKLMKQDWYGNIEISMEAGKITFIHTKQKIKADDLE